MCLTKYNLAPQAAKLILHKKATSCGQDVAFLFYKTGGNYSFVNFLSLILAFLPTRSRR